MIETTRAVVRQFRTVLRKAGAGNNQRPTVEVTATHGETRMCAQLPDVVITFKQPGSVTDESIAVPIEALADWEAKSNGTVRLAQTSEGIEARWEDGKIPKCKTYGIDKSATRPTIPNVPWRDKIEIPGVLQALARARHCISDQHPRYSTHRIQLRGKQGEIIATDGRQALIQSGFIFPWQHDVLIPSLALFEGRELSSEVSVAICLGDTHLGVEVGAFAFYLSIDKDGRYPNVASIIPRSTNAATTLRLSMQDASFLATSLEKLPGNHDDQCPVTLDLNGHVALRAKEEGQSQPTEVTLTGSQVDGAPVLVHTDRRFLQRAVDLGFTEITVSGADKPLLCKDSARTYIWVPLAKALAIPATDQAIRIVSQEESGVPDPIKERMKSPMPSSNSNGRSQATTASHLNGNGSANDNGQSNGTSEHADSTGGPASSSLGALIVEAQALRDYLHDGHARASRLCVSLKRHRKQSKLVASTLASLRQLQQIDG